MNRIKECRESRGYSQKYIAMTLGIKAPSVSNWEHGVTNPTAENYQQLADLFQVTTDYLMGRDGEKNKMVKETFARKFKMYVKEKGIQQDVLARKLSVSPSTVSSWINGDSYPRIEKLEAIASALGVEVDELTQSNQMSREETKVLNGYNALSEGRKKAFLDFLDFQLQLENIRPYSVTKKGDYEMDIFSIRVKARREELGITQEELAKSLGYKGASSIAKIEGGNNDVPLLKVIEIANALKTKPEYLAGWDKPDADEDREAWNQAYDYLTEEERQAAKTLFLSKKASLRKPQDHLEKTNE